VAKIVHAVGFPDTVPNQTGTFTQIVAGRTDATRLFGLSVLVVLRDERPEIVDLLVVLDAGEGHLGAGNFGFGIPDVFLEFGLVPGDAGILVGVRVTVVRHGAGLAAVQPVELGADLVLGAFADRMAGHVFVERRLASRDVLRQRGGRGCRRCDDGQRAQGQFFHGRLFVVPRVAL